MSRERFLIFKIGAIGDVVMALPLLSEIRRRHPDAHVTWVCGRTVAPILEATGKVDRIVTVDEGALYRSGAGARAREILKLWVRIGARRFDRALVGYQNWRYRLLILPAWSRATTCWSGSKTVRGVVPGRYHASEYIRLFFGEDGGQDSARFAQPEFPELRLPPAARDDGPVCVALAPGGAVNWVREEGLRRWPIHSYVALARQLAAKGYRVALTGAPSDGWVREHFEGVDFEDRIGKTDLPGLVAFYRSCGAVVTHDSGPLHLAILSGAPVVGLFGPTQPAEKTPAIGRVQVIWGGEDLPCRPCYDGKAYARCGSNRCMQSIPVEEVLERVREAVGR